MRIAANEMTFPLEQILQQHEGLHLHNHLALGLSL